MYALVLAGGKGERLRPLTDEVPKPMVSLADKPLLAHQVAWLQAGGVTDVVFLAGYRWKVIQDHFRDGAAYGLKVHYSVEDHPLGRGGALRKAIHQIPSEADPMVVVNGDVITDVVVEDLVSQYVSDLERDINHLGTLLVVPYQSSYGMVEMDGSGRVLGFREKVELPYWINGGVYILSHSIATHLPEMGDHEDSTFPKLAAAGKLTAYRFRGYWTSIDSLKNLHDAEEHLAQA